MMDKGRNYFKRHDNGKYESLIDAVKEDHIGVFNALIKQGADANLTDEKGCTALHYAAQRNDLFYIRHLVSAGADVNAENNDQQTPLCLLFKNMWFYPVTEAADILVSAGADVNVADKDGKTPLMYAQKWDEGFGALFLLAHGAM